MLTGPIASREKQQFAGNVGHAQTLVIGTDGSTRIVDAMDLPRRNMAIEPERLRGPAVERLIEEIPRLSSVELFTRLVEFGENIRPQRENPELAREIRRNFPDFGETRDDHSAGRRSQESGLLRHGKFDATYFR